MFNITRMGETRNGYSILVGKPEGHLGDIGIDGGVETVFGL